MWIFEKMLKIIFKEIANLPFWALGLRPKNCASFLIILSSFASRKWNLFKLLELYSGFNRRRFLKSSQYRERLNMSNESMQGSN